MPRLFVDMDGTLAVFTPAQSLETLYEHGYFSNLLPIENVVAAMKQVIRDSPDTTVYILSSVLTDSKFALAEKNAWLDRYLPEIPKERRIFPPCGEDKKNFIPGGVRETDVLLDDYTVNLAAWQPPARGIKLLNGINHTNRTWQGDCVDFGESPERIAESIEGIMQENLREKSLIGYTFTGEEIDDMLYCYAGSENENEDITFCLKTGYPLTASQALELRDFLIDETMCFPKEYPKDGAWQGRIYALISTLWEAAGEIEITVNSAAASRLQEPDAEVEEDEEDELGID